MSRVIDRCEPFFDVLKGPKKFKWTNRCEHAFQALKEHLGHPPLLSKSIDGEKLYLYLIFSKEAVSAALVKKKRKCSGPTLCEQEAYRHLNQISRVGKARFSSCDYVQKIKALLSCVLDRGPDQLPFAPNATEARGFRETAQMGDRVGVV